MQVCCSLIGPIPWGHSGPLSRVVVVVVVVVVDIDAQAALDSTASDICWMGVNRMTSCIVIDRVTTRLPSDVVLWRHAGKRQVLDTVA